ncbi:hypothetical protein B0H13DRAFT_1675373, partial [Mycena leptocephala]
VNLACKAGLAAITDMDFATPGSADFVPDPGGAATFLDAIARDPIRASSLRRQYFSEVLKALQQKDLQLLRDVDTRWSSTLLMIDRAILLREVILPSLCGFLLLISIIGNRQVPHAFQQRLSAEKTPTLGDALPAFEAMIKAWEKQQLSYPETAHIVQEGIYKLESYRDRVQDVPAYILSMREFSISLLCRCSLDVKL